MANPIVSIDEAIHPVYPRDPSSNTIFIFVEGVTNRRQSALLAHEAVAQGDGDSNKPPSEAGEI